jgi:hypothetical protein
VPEILRLNGMRVTPEADLRLHRGAFGSGVGFSVGWTLLVLVLLIVPGHPGLDLIKASVLAVR